MGRLTEKREKEERKKIPLWLVSATGRASRSVAYAYQGHGGLRRWPHTEALIATFRRIDRSATAGVRVATRSRGKIKGGGISG